MNADHMLKQITLQYIATGFDCYRKLADYVQNGCRGHLDLADTPVASLPDGLHVSGYLDLSNTPITSLPDGLHVGGYLSLAYTSITSLPDELHVGSSLNLMNTSIASLPDGLHVGGDMYLRNTLISKKHTSEQLEKMLPNVRGAVVV